MFRAQLTVALLCVLIACGFLPNFFWTLRTRIIHLRSLSTKAFHRHRPRLRRLLKEPYRRTIQPETPWLRCSPHGKVVTTGCLSLWSDSCLNAIASQRGRSPVCIALSYLLEDRYPFIFARYSCEVALVIFILYCRAYVSRHIPFNCWTRRYK